MMHTLRAPVRSDTKHPGAAWLRSSLILKCCVGMKLRKKLRSSLWSLDGFDQLFNRSPKSLLIYIKKQSDSQQKAVGWVSTFAGQVEQEGSKLTALVQCLVSGAQTLWPLLSGYGKVWSETSRETTCTCLLASVTSKSSLTECYSREKICAMRGGWRARLVLGFAVLRLLQKPFQ